MSDADVVVIGTGSIGRRHLRLLAAAGLTPLACSQHRRLRSVEVDGQRFETVNDLDAALASGPPVVIVANPTASHAATAALALDAGKHVLVEKPVALDDADLSPLRQAAREHPAQTVGVVQQFRFHPLLGHLRTAIGGEAVGRVVAVEARQGEHLADYHPGETYRKGYAARADLGGGVLRTQNHLLDLCAHLLGPLEVASAVVRQPGLLGLDVEDAASFVATAGPIDLYGRVDFLARPRRFSIDVVGDRGRATWDHYHSAFTVRSSHGQIEREVKVPFDRDALFAAVHDDFLEAVRTGRSPSCGLTEAARTVALTDRIRATGAARRAGTAATG